jgi:hypothetical protein
MALLPQVTVDFLNGSTVAGENYTQTSGPHLITGQSESLEIDQRDPGRCVSREPGGSIDTQAHFALRFVM